MFLMWPPSPRGSRSRSYLAELTASCRRRQSRCPLLMGVLPGGPHPHARSPQSGLESADLSEPTASSARGCGLVGHWRAAWGLALRRPGTMTGSRHSRRLLPVRRSGSSMARADGPLAHPGCRGRRLARRRGSTEPERSSRATRSIPARDGGRGRTHAQESTSQTMAGVSLPDCDGGCDGTGQTG